MIPKICGAGTASCSLLLPESQRSPLGSGSLLSIRNPVIHGAWWLLVPTRSKSTSKHSQPGLARLVFLFTKKFAFEASIW